MKTKLRGCWMQWVRIRAQTRHRLSDSGNEDEVE
jgi:hypothetical protein